MNLKQHFKFVRTKLKRYLLICIIVCVILKYLTCNDIEEAPPHLQEYVQFDERYNCSAGVAVPALYDKLERLNGAREVRNWAAHGPLHGASPVLAVRLARDPERLQYLIYSLAQVRNINIALVVFSHSFYDERIDRLIKSIKFCMVLQIYFPNSIQLFPNVFPGEEPRMCTPTMAKQLSIDCVDREPRLAEAKHHWWWTAHVLFEDLPWAQSHSGMVLFLEDGTYVLPDLLHILRFARSSLSFVPEAQLLAFGRPLARGLDRDKLTVDTWRPPYDKGIAFNRTVWNKIKTLSNHFCEYDDVSWSYSLLHALGSAPDGPPVMVASMAPRVISTTVFRSGKHALDNIYSLSRSADLFPAKVKTVVLYGSNGRIYRRGSDAPPRGNGGWRDLRDQLLCMDPMTSTVTYDDATTTPPIFTTQKLKPIES